VSSPWELADGFRVNMPPAIRVRLRANGSAGASQNGNAGAPQSSALLDATVGAQSGNSAEVHVGNTAPQRLTRLPASAPLQQWQSASGGERASVLVSNNRITVWQSHARVIFTLDDGLQFDASSSARAGSLSTPLPGVVVSVAVKEGDKVAAGQVLLVIEAMKMEHAIKAPRPGVVKALKYRVGDRVREGSVLAEVD
jgi:3-methylcrotonyl-CoA carboxylase alpha subunit